MSKRTKLEKHARLIARQRKRRRRNPQVEVTFCHGSPFERGIAHILQGCIELGIFDKLEKTGRFKIPPEHFTPPEGILQ